MNKQYFSYIRVGKKVYTRFTFKKPSDEILSDYLKIRTKVAAKAKLLARKPSSGSILNHLTTSKQHKKELRLLSMATTQIHKICREKKISVQDATAKFNKEFNTDFSYRQIYQRLYRQGNLEVTKRPKKLKTGVTPS